MKSFSFIAGCIALWGASGCGYTLQTSKNSHLAKSGIRRVYVRNFLNNTYKPGIENVIYNSLSKTLASQRRVELVQHESEADAVIEGSVDQASATAASSIPASSLQTVGVVSTDPLLQSAIVASNYGALLTCSFKLTRPQQPGLSVSKVLDEIPGKPSGVGRQVLWFSTFSRSKNFPGANQLGVGGETAPLINDSEFDRALSEIATSMMMDVHEAMLDLF